MTEQPFPIERSPSLVSFVAPWVLAPFWVFLPVGGCGLAKVMLKTSTAEAHQGRDPDAIAGGATDGGPVVRMVSAMTVETPPGRGRSAKVAF